MALFSKDLGIDLGTMFIRVVEGNQIVLQEPTVAAIVVEEQKMVAWGQEAQDMFGRVPESLEVIRPLHNGVIADYEVTEYLLEALLRKLSSPVRIFRPRVMITVPYGVTSVESRAVHEAALQAGTREAFLIQQPLAAAIGVDLPIGTPSGNMIVCLGGGCTQAAVLAMYGIVSAETMRAGGMALDEAIVNYVRKKYGLIIGPADRRAGQDQDRRGGAAGRRAEHGNAGARPGQRLAAPGEPDHRRGRRSHAPAAAGYDRDHPPGAGKDPPRAGLRYYRPRAGADRRRGAAARHG